MFDDGIIFVSYNIRFLISRRMKLNLLLGFFFFFSSLLSLLFVFWCFFFLLTYSSKLKRDGRERERKMKSITDTRRRVGGGRRRRRKRLTGTISLSMGKRLNKLLLLSDLIYTWRSMHIRVCSCVCVQYVNACMYFETGNYDNCCRLPNLPASIIWMGKSRKRRTRRRRRRKTVMYFFCG